MSNTILALLIGYLLDLIGGDPHWMWHPVIGIGKMITCLEKRLRKKVEALGTSVEERQRMEKKMGLWLVILLCLAAVILSSLLLGIAYLIHPYCKLALESFMCYQILAAKSLKTESMKVWSYLKANNTEGARRAVSMLVGRNTEALDEQGIIKACVETIAENTSDGVIAPICYMIPFGAVGGFLYKAVNTMDSMLGYKNESYLHFGRAAAKLDDWVNFIPARITAVYMIAAAFLLRLDGKNAIRIFKRDRFCHASPNSAQTESVCAGALRVQLAGDAFYFGKLYQKQKIGDADRAVEAEDIKRANLIMYTTVFLMMATVTVIAGCLNLIGGGL